MHYFEISFQYLKVNELWEHKNSERLAAIITCMYVNGAYGQTNEILSNMETKLFLVLHVDHKPLNIKTTQWNRLRNVNAIVLFIQKNRSSTVLVLVYRPAGPDRIWRPRFSRGNRRGGV